MATYNAMSPAELAALAPGFDWTAYLAAGDLAGRSRVVVTENTAFPKIAAIYADTPLATLKAWQAFHLVDRRRGAPSVEALRRRQLRVPQQGDERPAGAEAALEARRGVRRRRHRRVGGPALCRPLLPAGVQGQDGGLVGDLRTALHARIEKLALDERRHQGQGAGEAAKFTVKIGYPDKWRDYSSLDDLEAGRPLRQRRAGRLRMAPRRLAAERAGGPHRMGHDAADGERLLQPDQQRDRLPGRHPAAAVLRSQGRPGDQLRRHRRGDRPRDHPRLRRPGPQVRRRRASSPTGGRRRGRRQVQGPDRPAGRAVLGLRAAARRARQRRPDHGREHRRPGRPAAGARRLSRLAEGQARAGDRRPDRRPAGLPGLGAGLARQAARRRPAPAAGLRSALAAARARVDGVVRNIDAWYAAFGVKPGDALYVAPDQRVRIW